MRIILSLTLVPALKTADVVINEFQASPSDRQLFYPENNAPPRIGPAPAWQDPAFEPITPWQPITLPAGWGHSGLSTDLSSAMRGTTPTIYLRNPFTITPAQAVLPGDLELSVQADDGFVAFLNGHEIARSNAAAPGAFLHFDQPAFNTAFTSAPVIYPGPAAATLLVPGTNTFAIQAHNADLDSTFRIASSLRILGPNIDTSVTLFEFENATGAASTHTRNANSSSGSTTGTPITGGWLASAPQPTSSSAWQNLTITATESAADDTLIYTFDGSSPPAPLSLHAPPASMTGLWQSGNVNLTALASTRLSFRYKVTGNALFDLTLCANGSTSKLTGLPPVGTPPPVPDRGYNDTSGASLDYTIDNSGDTAESTTGTLAHQYWWFSASGLRDGQFRSSEQSTAISPAGGLRGTHRMTIVDTPSSTGGAEWWGFGHPGFTVDDWTPGNTTNTDLSKTRLTFFWRLTAGRSLNFRLEPDGASWEQRLDFGTHTGTGTWQLFDRTLSSADNATDFLDFINGQSHTDFRVVVSSAASIDTYQDGDFLDLDDFTFIYDDGSDPGPDTWRNYTTTLDRATDPAAFLATLNDTGSLKIHPSFEKIPDATPGQSLTIDDFTVSYAGPSPVGGRDLVSANATWQAYPGITPPSGGVTEPTDPASGFVDWIELHNTGTSPADLTGWAISDNPGSPTKFPFPPGTTIPANGHLLLLCDGPTDLNGTSPFIHTNFKLSSSGETISLTAPTPPPSTPSPTQTRTPFTLSADHPPSPPHSPSSKARPRGLPTPARPSPPGSNLHSSSTPAASPYSAATTHPP